MNALYFYREFSRKDENWYITLATRRGGSWSGWLKNEYGMNWGNFETDDQLLTHLDEVFKRMLADGWAEAERSLSRRIFLSPGNPLGKFWIAWLDGNAVMAHYGKETKHPGSSIGGQVREIGLPDPDEAMKAYERMIADKLVDGYVELYPRETSYAQIGLDLAKRKAAAPKIVRKVKAPSAEENVAKMLGKTARKPTMSRREFHFSEGASNKFWAIELEGASQTVHYGRVGTSGQAQTKTFASEEEAKKASDKLIAEKVKKGYQEVTSGETKSSGTPSAKPAKGKTAAAKPSEPEKEEADQREEAANAASPLAQDDKPKPAVNTDVVRRIDLNPADWYWAKWRKLAPLPRIDARPFNFDACMSLLKEGQSWYDVRYGDGLRMSPEEAHFWFLAMFDDWGDKKQDSSDARNARRVKQMKARGRQGAAAPDEVAERMKEREIHPTDLSYLLALLPPADMVELALDPNLYAMSQFRHSNLLEFMLHFQSEIIPYLKLSEMEALRKRVARELTPIPPLGNTYDPYPVAFYLGGLFGCHDELAAFVRSWPDNRYSDRYASIYQYPEIVLYGLGDSQLLIAEARRLGFKPNDGIEVFTRGWLAHTEYHALDVIAKSVASAWDKRRAEEQVRLLTLVKAPEVAPVMLELSQGGRVVKQAREWLNAEAGYAITGLTTVAAGKGKLAEAALAYLREKKKEGRGKLIAAALKNAPADASSRIKELVLDREEKTYPEFAPASSPAWLAAAAKSAAAKKPLPGASFVAVAQLPPIVIDDKRLNQEQVASLLLALQHAESTTPDDLIAGLHKHADRASLDAFVWALFDQWLAVGAPPKHKWAMRALGFLGSDAIALKLTPLIRNWPGESQHQRAVAGLECLRQMGTDTALMQLNGIAVKLKFKGLQNKAREFMEAIAAEKGLTPAQLEDRIVPDCDLDERGSRVFDFGPRQFRLVLGPDMKPMIKDPEGKVKTDLPKPGAKDDAAKAAESIAAWKLMKKQVKEVATIQASRLEQAMVTGRRWPVADFETLLVKHPLMTNLVRMVLWGGYDKKGKLATAFRVTEDQSCADAKDSSYKLSGVESVGVVHPLQLTEDQKSIWGEVFSDYEIVPPFPQLGRPIFHFTPDELKTDQITRFAKIAIPCATLTFGLEKLGWTRGDALDNGHVSGYSKHFPSADLSAVVIFEQGFSVGYREGWEDQNISDIYFAPGQYRVAWGRRSCKDEKTIPLKDLDPVIASEVLRDLTGLAAKGK